MNAGDKGWWHDFFPAFRPIFDQISRRQTNAEVRYVAEKLKLRPGQKFLDCPCGIGRFSLPLAARGIRVTAVDITTSYLQELASKARRRHLPIKCIRSDMRRINFDRQFDAAANLGTSFGYFEDEADNLLTLKRMFRALKPGGRFLLHVSNRDSVMAHFVPRDWNEIKGTRILQRRTFDYAKSIIRSNWLFIRDGHEQEFRVDIRVYSCHELIEMFTRVGFVDIETSGSESGDPIDRNRKMLFVLGTRPKTAKTRGGKS